MGVRGLQHTKSNRIEISKGIPSPNEGNNGELRLGITSKGIFLYAKYGNRWYQISDAAVSSGGNFSSQGVASSGGGQVATSIDRSDESLSMAGNIKLSGNLVTQSGSSKGVGFDSSNNAVINNASTKVGTNSRMTLSDNEIDVSSGDLTLDVASSVLVDSNYIELKGLGTGTKVKIADADISDAFFVEIHAQGAAPMMCVSGESENFSELYLYEAGGLTTNDFFKIEVLENGESRIRTIDAAGATAHLDIIPDGDLRLQSSVKVKEQASADADSSTYGQLWVKNTTPNELYFTTDAGDDIQITSGTGMAGGSSADTVIFGPFTARVGSINSDTKFWTCGSYGLNYPFWSSSNDLADRDHGWHDTNEYGMSLRTIHVPWDGTLKGMTASFYSAGANTYLFEIWKATPSYPTSSVSDLVFADTGLGITSSGSHSYKIVQISKTDGNVSVSAGDLLAIYISRASGTASAYIYPSLSVIMEKS